MIGSFVLRHRQVAYIYISFSEIKVVVRLHLGRLRHSVTRYNSGDEGDHPAEPPPPTEASRKLWKSCWLLEVIEYRASAVMALATNLGNPTFDENQDKWDIYLTRLEAFFEANDIKTDDKKRAHLVSTLSTKTVGILAGHSAPRKVNDLSYKEALTFLNDHYAPKCNEVAASYKFFARDQAANESVRDYVVELRKLADKCNFGTSLDRMLRDRIVCGIRNRAVQQTLLERTVLTLAQAEMIATAAETAALEVSAMTRPDNEAAVCSVARKSRRYQSFTKDKQIHTDCARCGNYDHEASDCPHKREQCFRCRKTGHFARKCRSQSGLRAGRRRDGSANAAVHYESAVSETEESDISSLHIAGITRKEMFAPGVPQSYPLGWSALEHDY